MLGLPTLEGTNPATCCPGTAIGNEATCYSRVWSEVSLFRFFTHYYALLRYDTDFKMIRNLFEQIH